MVMDAIQFGCIHFPVSENAAPQANKHKIKLLCNRFAKTIRLSRRGALTRRENFE